MNPILYSKSKLDIQVHEKTNLSIVSSTQDPGGLIPVGLGFPYFRFSHCLHVLCTRLKSQHRTSVIVGGQTETDDPSDQA